jgi:phosphohistidine phosphatase
MDLYLMQHGEALSAEQDPERPLTDTGRASVDLVATKAGAAGVRVPRCFHSGKLRAEQTARILMDEIGPRGDVEPRAGLGPNDPVAETADWLRDLDADGPVAVVGHLPFLERLVSLLVVGDEDARTVRFHNGGLVRLVSDADGSFSVDWVLTPELAC